MKKLIALFISMLVLLKVAVAEETLLLPLVVSKDCKKFEKYWNKRLERSAEATGYKFLRCNVYNIQSMLLAGGDIEKLLKKESPKLSLPRYLILPTAFRFGRSNYVSAIMMQLKRVRRIVKVVNIKEKGKARELPKLFDKIWKRLKEKEEVKEREGSPWLLLMYSPEEMKSKVPAVLMLNYMLEEFWSCGYYKLTLPILYSRKLIEVLKKYRRAQIDAK